MRARGGKTSSAAGGWSSNLVPDGCDAFVIATEWPLFRKLDLERARKVMTCPIMFDGRNLLDPKEMEALGWIGAKRLGRPAFAGPCRTPWTCW